MKLGKTGEFPKGKLNRDDEGQLTVAITTEKNVVRIDFGTELSWIGMDKELALDFAQGIINKANTLK